MLMLTRFSIYIDLLRDIANNINLLKGVKINKNKHLSKSSFKFLKTLFNIRSLLKKSSFSAIFYIN
jgi:hypothetical protein